MNTLSILLYLADIFHSLISIAAVFFSVALIGLIVLLVIRGVSIADSTLQEVDNKKSILNFLVVTLVTGFLLVFVPSKDTVYLIAASEIGEDVIESPVTQRLATKIEMYLDNVLEIEEK
jgi:hypothetical protein